MVVEARLVSCRHVKTAGALLQCLPVVSEGQCETGCCHCGFDVSNAGPTEYVRVDCGVVDGLQDLVREVASGAALKTNNHRIFKLEDVAMGSWIEYIAKEKGWAVQYINHQGFNYGGCSPNDVVSHYIKPQQARCIHQQHDRSCCARMHHSSSRRKGSHFLSFLL